MTKVIYVIGGMTDIKHKSEALIAGLYNDLKDSFKERGDASYCIHLHHYRRKNASYKKQDPLKEQEEDYVIPWMSNKPISKYTEGLLSSLQNLDLNHKNKDELYIVAYSAGSAIFLDCLGTALHEYSQDQSRHPWLHCLKHTIHIAGMTLGWEFNSEMPKCWLVFGPLIKVIPFANNLLTGLKFSRGSDFITDMRIKNSEGRLLFKGIEANRPLETYILGTKDKILSPSDAIEPGFDTAHTKYYELQGCGHDGILKNRKLVLLITLICSDAKIGEGAGIAEIRSDYLDDYLDPMDNRPPEKDTTVKHVIIILHGIRDNGYWAKRIGHRIKKKWTSEFQIKPEKKNQNMRTITLSYGYFSLWDFVRPGGRRKAVQWFQNAYADIKSLYPCSHISFIGHSNGTYLGTQALKCSFIKFRLMLLAGSVVRRDYWRRNPKALANVSLIINIQAMHDWIVALFPGGFESYWMVGRPMDLGGAGAFGFYPLKIKKSTTNKEAQYEYKENNKLKNIRILGDHGAGIDESKWEKIAKYVCEVHDLINDDVKTGANEDCQETQAVDLPFTLEKINRPALLINKILSVAKYITGMAIPAAFVVYYLPVIAACFLWADILPWKFAGTSAFSSPYFVMGILFVASSFIRAVLTRV